MPPALRHCFVLLLVAAQQCSSSSPSATLQVGPYNTFTLEILSPFSGATYVGSWIPFQAVYEVPADWHLCFSFSFSEQQAGDCKVASNFQISDVHSDDIPSGRHTLSLWAKAPGVAEQRLLTVDVPFFTKEVAGTMISANETAASVSITESGEEAARPFIDTALSAAVRKVKRVQSRVPQLSTLSNADNGNDDQDDMSLYDCTLDPPGAAARLGIARDSPLGEKLAWQVQHGDFPRLCTILDFVKWTRRHNLTRPGSVLTSDLMDPELLCLRDLFQPPSATPSALPPVSSSWTAYAFDGERGTGDLHEIDAVLPQSQYDLAVISQTLEHVVSPGRALEAVRNVLVPGGHVFVSVPALSISHMAPFVSLTTSMRMMTVLAIKRLASPDPRTTSKQPSTSVRSHQLVSPLSLSWRVWRWWS